MGTRYLTCVVKDGGYKIAQYGQYDGYPEHAGLMILYFLKVVDPATLAEHVSQLLFLTDEESQQFYKEFDSYLKSMSVEKSEALREEDHERYNRPTIELIDKYFSRPFIQLHRDLGWQILELIMTGNSPPLDNSIKFAGDSLFCEWVYVIDLDENKFEVYRGFNKEPVPEGERFCYFEGSDGYNPVKHLATFKLDQLPSDENFLERCPDSL